MEALPMWTLYKGPGDPPEFYALRRFDVLPGGPRPTDEIHEADAAEPLRQMMRERGRVCLARSEQDAPNVVETWL
jgi:hypothetical protein